MTGMILDALCLTLSLVFFWSTLLVLVGLFRKTRPFPKAERRLRFAILICARNEERVIRLPIGSLLAARWPADRREIIVIADNCTDATAAFAREAGATVWEKTTPSSGKGDVLAWGVSRVLARGGFDAIAVFDADNVASEIWFETVNDALAAGEAVVTGRRHASNARANVISGWYAIYWGIINELSNRVRTNLGLSGKLTGTGFAFRLDALGPDGWQTSTMVEDVEFTVQSNLAGHRIAYVPGADYADEQPVAVHYMWRQLCRWSTGGWEVVRRYTAPWIGALVRRPTLRLFDSFFAILTGMSVAFILLFNVGSLAVRLAAGQAEGAAFAFFGGIFFFVFAMGWITAAAAVALSQAKGRPPVASILLFPVFSLILCATVLFSLVRPTRRWKPIPHG